MNMNRMSLIVVGFCFFCLFWGSSLRARNTINWLAHGDLRGHFESCGCDPKTDLGGLGRFATFLKREMLETQQVIIFDLGNNFSLKTKDSEKNHYINKALIQIDPHFSLLNYTEFLLGKRILEKRTFILSNLRNNITIFPHKILAIDSIQHVSVLGFLWADDLEDHLRPMNKILINDWKNRLKNTTKYKILLFSGNDKQLKFVEEQKIFNLIISSNDAPLKSESIYEEKENSLLLERTPETLMVPWGGLGVLRGGGLKENKAPSIQQLLAPKSLNKQQQV